MFKISLKEILPLLFYSILNSALSLGILFIINTILSGDILLFGNYLFAIFFGLVGMSYVLNIGFQRRLIELSNSLIYENEVKILNSLGDSRLSTIESLGKERIYGILEDLRSLVFIPYIIANGLNSLLIFVGGLIYFFYISYEAALLFLLTLGLFIGWYFYRNIDITRKFKVSRGLNDYYFQIIRDFLEGFKELKLSLVRQANIQNEFLIPNRKTAKEMEGEVFKSFLSLNLLGQYGLYLIIGVVIFVFPYINLIDRTQVIPFVIIILFLIGPINILVSLQSFYTRMRVAVSRISDFLNDLSVDIRQTENHNKKVIPKDFKEIHLDKIIYVYPNSHFTLGPLNLKLLNGETVFVVGGNGSGKSTFINILINLYDSTSGEVHLNGVPIGSDNQEYRELFSAIFTDNHLFSNNYEDYSLDDNPEYSNLLKLMQLDDVVLDEKEESARRKFSKGQSKRMAMIFALLNKCPIFVLDEWAADQDPYFRKYFYEKLLPQLKKEGKTVIAVTHDDAYFQHADRILKFQFGQIVEDIRTKNQHFSVESLWRQ